MTKNNETPQEVNRTIKLIQDQATEICKLNTELSDLREAYIRIQYLLEGALSYLNDNDLINDFVEDRDVDITPEECEFYELEVA